MIRLSDYLEDVLQRPWQWGEVDCVHFAGDWILQATGRDPLAPYRDTYDSALGARRLIAQRGGLVTMVDAEMVRTGFTRARSPEHGDIGVLAQPGVSELAAARACTVIFDGRWWIALMLDGIAGTEDEPVAAWRVAA